MISAFDFYVDISDENSKFLFRVVIFIQTLYLGWYQSSGGNDVIDTGPRDRKRWHVCWRLSFALLIMTLLSFQIHIAIFCHHCELNFLGLNYAPLHHYIVFSAAELLLIPRLYTGHGTGTRSTGRVAAGDDNNTQTARNPPQIWYPLLSALLSVHNFTLHFTIPVRERAHPGWYELDLATWFPGPKEGCVT